MCIIDKVQEMMRMSDIIRLWKENARLWDELMSHDKNNKNEM